MAVQSRALAISGRFGQLGKNRQLLINIAVVALSSVGVKAAGMLRDIVVASEFGTSDAADAFIAAWVIPQFLATIVGAAFAGALIPAQAEARKAGGDQYARTGLSEMILISILALGTTTLLLAPLRDTLLPLVTSNFDPPKLAETRDLYSIMLPAVFLYAVNTVWSSVLHTEERFGLAAVSPVIVPLTTIAALVIYPQGGITSPAVGFVIGCLAQSSALLVGLQRHGLAIMPRWHGGMPETRLALFQLAPFLANGVVFGGIGVVDQAMAATLGQGSMATLNYANKLVLPVLAIGSSALATVVYPRFSRLAAEQDWVRLQSQVKTYLRLLLVVTIPVTLAIIATSHLIVELLFERGQFTAADTNAVSRLQIMFALMIPCYTMSQLLSSAINAMRATRLMLIGSVAIALFNVIADYLFKGWIGIRGIALATVLNYCLALLINGYLVWRLTNARIEQARQEGQAP